MVGGGARLVYLYQGCEDVDRDLRFYTETLGAELVWRFDAYDTEVAAVRLGDGPLVLLAGHRDAPGVIQIWAVNDLEQASSDLERAGWAQTDRRVGVPDGTCLLLTDPSGNELALLDQVRPGVLERRFQGD